MMPARERSTGCSRSLRRVGLVSVRDLGPLIGQLRVRHNLNILGMEALAAASRLEAEVFLSAPAPRLIQALNAEGRTATIVG